MAVRAGANVVINCKKENLKERGTIKLKQKTLSLILMLFCTVLQETDNNGVGRLLEATGSAVMVNQCFSLLR